jgi:hypothetical protein
MNEQTTQQTDLKKNNEKNQKIVGGLFISLLILFWIVFNFLSGLIIALIGTVVSSKLLEKKPEVKKFIPAIFVVLIVAIFGAIFLPAIQSDTEFRDERDEILAGASQTYDYLTEAETAERNIEVGVLKALGHETEIRKIDFNEGEVWIDYIASDNLTTNLTRRGILSDTVNLVKELSSIVSQDIDGIVVEAHLTLVDQYGEESISKVAMITISKETWDKINWDNFLNDNLPNIDDTYWQHPTLND